MKSITELNGFYYLNNFPEDEIPDWVTTDYKEGSPYFHLNKSTRLKFRRDLYDDYKAGKIAISPTVFSAIKEFIQNPKNIYSEESAPTIVSPEGITLMSHQTYSVEKMIEYNKYGFFLGTGTGKTLIAITYLLTMKINKALIVTPKKVIGQYKQELDKYIPNNNHTVINYESVSKVAHENFDCLILDESHKVKNYTSNINTLLRKFAKDIKRVYLFTGTPQDKSKHEIFPQLAVLNIMFMPGKSRFYHRYFHLDDYYQPKSVKAHLSDELTVMIEAITWGKESKDVIELTKEHNNILQCDYPGEAYKTLVNTRLYTLPDDYVVVADNKASLKIKLREMCNGHIIATKDDASKVFRLPNSKLKHLEQLLSSLSSAIIYSEFKEDIPYIEETCTKLHATYVIVDGSTRNASSLIDRFKAKEVQFLIIQSKCGNAGLDLSCTNNIVFYSLPESYIIFHQCKSRIQRKGQTAECNYFYLICKNTVEEQMYRALSKKKSFSTKLFKIYD